MSDSPPTWQALLGVAWPRNACDRSGECCRGAAQVAPWQNILKQAAHGDHTARAFLNQYEPYPDRAAAEVGAPHGVAASLAIAAERGDDPEEVIFYRCRFLAGQSECRIYEDRPQFCRDFPESPFGAVPSCCGYAALTRQCRSQIQAMRDELLALKRQQSVLEWEQPASTTEEE